MTRVLDRQKAHDLRLQGKSYSQIKTILGLSKSTLSVWLREYPLTKEQIDVLRGKNPIRIERFRETMRLKREKRLQEVYSNEKKNLLPMTQKELFIAGLFLYWGEGAKAAPAVSVSNTDPRVLKFMLFWLTDVCNIEKQRIKVYLHLYSDMNVSDELIYWSKALSMPLEQFTKPYIKVSTREGITQKGYGHGTCGLVVGSVILKERIMMGIKAISDFYSQSI